MVFLLTNVGTAFNLGNNRPRSDTFKILIFTAELTPWYRKGRLRKYHNSKAEQKYCKETIRNKDYTNPSIQRGIVKPPFQAEAQH